MQPTDTKNHISRHLIEKLMQLESGQNDYMPGPGVARQLSDKTLIMVVAPTCMGKSTVIRRVTELDERFGIVGSFTTREPRAEEIGKQFTYIPHTDEGLGELFGRIDRYEIVQYIVHPTTKHIYGTDISHYPKRFNLLDFMATGVEGIRKLPFLSTPVISIAADPSQWMYWFNQRFPEGHPERHHRRDEARYCLEWLLGQPIKDVHWVVTGDGLLDQAANEVIRIGSGNTTADLSGRRYAELCLAETLRMK